MTDKRNKVDFPPFCRDCLKIKGGACVAYVDPDYQWADGKYCSGYCDQPELMRKMEVEMFMYQIYANQRGIPYEPE